MDFEIVTIIEGAGNSTALLDYKTIDATPYTGTSFYRLKQTDFDGAFEYSEVRRVEIEGDGIVNVYPNPVQSGGADFVVDLSNFNESFEELRIIDAYGKTVYLQNKDLKGVISLNTKNLAAGIYFIQLTKDSLKTTSRMIIH